MAYSTISLCILPHISHIDIENPNTVQNIRIIAACCEEEKIVNDISSETKLPTTELPNWF